MIERDLKYFFLSDRVVLYAENLSQTQKAGV